MAIRAAGAHARREGTTRRAIVQLLKTDGALDSGRLAKRLRLTPMAVRQHLYALQREKLVVAEEHRVPRGRPAKHWHLTPEADHLFPDAHDELSLSLMRAVGKAFGSSGLKRVLEARSALQRAYYHERIPASASLEGKLRALARIRTDDGCMAEVRRQDAGFLFVERHCPIRAAASAWEDFRSMELELFRAVLGPRVDVERMEHIIDGDLRTVYRVAPTDGTSP